MSGDKGENMLLFGDNLAVLRLHVPDESVDLVYLDPPFNSNAAYNILYKEQNGTRSAAQVKAFEDTWEWNTETERTYKVTVEAGGKVSEVLRAFHTFLGTNNLMAYLTMMAPRLIELRRVMKPTASLYLHCDPTASHYLKMLLDAVFGPENFQNEIVWRRTGAHGKVRRYAPVHDILLFYSKDPDFYWQGATRPYMRGHVREYFVEGKDGTWKTAYYGNVLTGSGLRGGESGKPWKGFDPSAKGRHWAIPGKLVEGLEEDLSALPQHAKLDRLFERGFIKIVPGQAWPIYERTLEPDEGTPVSDLWAFQPYTEGTVFGTEDGVDADVRWLSPRDAERLGYQTQKPVGLLKRIIEASCPKKGLVLDPFCGCGTTVVAAQETGRKWIGIDITILAIRLIKERLADKFGSRAKYAVLGEPTTVSEAKALAESNPYQFQWWALDLVGARPAEEKKGADRGIDGRLLFHDDAKGDRTKQVILSVKAGAVTVSHVRDLRGVLDREKAEIGVLISMEEPTKTMKKEAATAGFYRSPYTRKDHPRLQLLTVAEILGGT